MTSWNANYCGPFNRSGHMQHMIDPDIDGNVMCSRPGCYHMVIINCTCRIDPGWTKYIGCPTHTENARYVSRRPYPSDDDMRALRPFMPEDMGGDVSLEEADRLAKQLIHSAHQVSATAG